jgi:hypothetical protein
VEDVAPHELPPEAWTLGQNVRFQDKSAIRMLGESQVEGAPTVVPNYLFPSPSVSDSFWVYTDLAKFYATVGGVHTDITNAGGDYTGGLDDAWNGGWLNGLMLLNNGIEDPQLWDPISAGQRLVDLTNWPATTQCKVMRVFQEFLMALYVTKSSVEFPTMVKWSHPADPGSVPVTWDESDATKLAGELPIGDTAGFIVDGKRLGPSFMVYKEDAIVRMDRVQTNDVFTKRPISLRTGLMAQECAQEWQRGQHVLLTRDADVVLTDGQVLRPITDRRVRRRL